MILQLEPDEVGLCMEALRSIDVIARDSTNERLIELATKSLRLANLIEEQAEEQGYVRIGRRLDE